MPQDGLNERNQGMVAGLSSDFETLQQHFGSGAQCNAFFTTHANGGGNLRFGHLEDNSNWLRGRAGSLLTEVAITCVDYFATARGGPYVHYDGQTEYFSSADTTWQEPTNNTFLVGGWVNAIELGALNRCIVSKYTTVGNQRSWALLWNTVSGTFRFSCNALGTLVGNVTIDSTYNEQLNTWYFVMGYFQPSTLMRIYVASPTDNDLTIDSLGVGVPASLFNGGSSFGIGCREPGAGAAEFWSGYIGMLLGRCAVSATQVDAHVRRLWAETRYLYSA